MQSEAEMNGRGLADDDRETRQFVSYPQAVRDLIEAAPTIIEHEFMYGWCGSSRLYRVPG